MRKPVEREALTAADGTVYTVASIYDDDPESILITLVEGTDPDDMTLIGLEFDGDEFEEFCKRENIILR